MRTSGYQDAAPPAVLISSSNDVNTAREMLDARISRIATNLRIEVESFLWKESTRDGLSLRSSETIQNQINELLDGRIELTFVMFGERIGQSLGLNPPPDAAGILEEWEAYGLTHPWPDDQADRKAALDAGKFPLTGTVYEMFVALGVERRDRKLRLKVGYVADKPLRPETKLGDICFNGGRLERSLEGNSGSEERDRAEREYKQQTHGIINLFQALMRSAVQLEPHRYDTEEEMAAAFGVVAEESLRRRAVAEHGEQAFKPDLSHFSLDDIMKLPDRWEKRQVLHERFTGDGEAGRVLLLTGPSGCGKSSLLQKGLLGELKGQLAKAVAVAVRPTDFSPRTEKTPLRKFYGFLLDVLEERGVAGLQKLRRVPAGSTDQQLDAAASGLLDTLVAGGHKLVLGVDQFEEILDYASLEGEEEKSRPGSWWQLLRFIGRIAQGPGIWVAATLETQRKDRLEEMGLRKDGVLLWDSEHVGFEVGTVRHFVLHVARDKGLPLDISVAEALQSMVEGFEKQKVQSSAGQSQASFLPLLSLWMHRLFSSFRDRIVAPGDDGITGVFDTSTKLIEPQDIVARGLQFDLQNLVSDLVQDAWKEASPELASELAGLGKFRVTDFDSFRDHISRLSAQNSQIKALVAHCNTPAGFDSTSFLGALVEDFARTMPGVEENPKELSEEALLSLGRFYSGLVKFDGSANKRLIDMPGNSSVDSIQRLINSHLSRRLLEPVGENGVRLVHQAVIDNWLPGRLWFASRSEQFDRRRRLESLSRDRSELEKRTAAAAKDLVVDALYVLDGMQSVWGIRNLGDLKEEDQSTIDFCFEILASETDGTEVFEVEEQELSPLKIAAIYGQADLIDKWLDRLRPKSLMQRLRSSFAPREDVVNRSYRPKGSTPLMSASWASEPAVEVLLKHGARFNQEDKAGWHPVAGAIQAGQVGIVQKLLPLYGTTNPVIGPSGFTAAHEAARSTQTGPLEYLVQKFEAPLPASDEVYAITPLQIAAAAGRVEHIEMLMPFGGVAERDASGNTCIDRAVHGDHGVSVRTILESEHLDDGDRTLLLTGAQLSDDRISLSPLALAAALAAPKAMAVLLEHCPDPTDAAHSSDGMNLVEALLHKHNVPSTSGSVQDRVIECLNLLLNNDRIRKLPLQRALEFTQYIPAARRIIENKFILEGNLEGVPPPVLLSFACSKRQRVARAALSKRPDILDFLFEDGRTGAQLLLQNAEPGVLSHALRKKILPGVMDPALFSLQAALRILTAYKKGSDETNWADQVKAPLKDLFIGIDRTALHELVLRFLDDPETGEFARLIEMGGKDGEIAPFLHRLAIRNEEAIFAEVLFGMSGSVPLDAFGRRPSELAPDASQADFAAIEKKYEGQRIVQ
ncbi:hypothetical protein [uncultured Roseobacter sp.]|uniref:nSTAND1 domain-containing NTPase n=1 Tax=uncultured Roseobacter sp. TaxID=114847 RepID=UPI002630DAA8|nr:hypothetical protein [uncultured Roseobacter sp.]